MTLNWVNTGHLGDYKILKAGEFCVLGDFCLGTDQHLEPGMVMFEAQ